MLCRILGKASFLTIILTLVASGRGLTQQTLYNVLVLDTPPGNATLSYYINASGQVYGTANEGPVLWTPTTRIQVLPAAATPGGLNNSGLAAGIGPGGPFSWQDPLRTQLTVPSGMHVDSVFGVNNLGDIYGVGATTDILNNTQTHIIVWNNGIVRDRGAMPGARGGLAYAVNDSGQVVGSQIDGLGDERHAILIQNDGTALNIGGLGGTYATATAISNNGLVVGFASLAGNQVFYGFVWRVGDAQPTSIQAPAGDTFCIPRGVNNAGTIVGDAVFPFVYSGGTYYDLNKLLIDPQGVVLTSAVAINEAGQIAANGTLNGTQHAFLLTPAGEQVVDPDTVQLLDTRNHPVEGIVCDNLRWPNPQNPDDAAELYNRLIVQLPAGAQITSYEPIKGAAPSNGFLALDSTGTKLVYYPPDEYNETQEPSSLDEGQITQPASREITVTVRFKAVDGPKLLQKVITLARPPVVLVHGINSSPADWNPLKDMLTGTGTGQRGYRIPFVAVNHFNPRKYGSYEFTPSLLDLRFDFSLNTTPPAWLFRGNGPVEIGADLLRQRIQTTIAQVRSGCPIDDSDQNTNGPHGLWEPILRPSTWDRPEQNIFPDYAGHHLAIKRVDVVAWSYGGAITRWYLASGSTSPSRGWYRRDPAYTITGNDGSSIDLQPDTPYGNDVRKVITLGTMWRGAPLCNFANEIWFSQSSGDPMGLWQAPFGPNFTLFGFDMDQPTLFGAVGLLGGTNTLNVPTNVPSMEVAAVSSRWMYYMTEAASVTAPFRPEVAYAAIAGSRSEYLPAALGDTYDFLDNNQVPTWFPYLGLDGTARTGGSSSDGIVPLWSSAIPGKAGLTYYTVPAAHNEYAKDTGTQALVALLLNGFPMRLGQDLVGLWDTPVTTSTGKSWSFEPLAMAPRSRGDIYQLDDNGVARIAQAAIRERNRIDTPRKLKSMDSFTVVWDTATPATGIVQVYDTGHNWVTSQLESFPTKSHSIRIPGLNPNTKYLYSVSFVVDGTILELNRAGDKDQPATWTLPAPALNRLLINPSSVTPGSAATGTVVVSDPDTRVPVTVTLTTDRPSLVTVPRTVTVPAGSSSATFVVNVIAPSIGGEATISATYGGKTISAKLRVRAF